MNIQFGPGVLILTPNAGQLATDPTPQQPPVLQEFSVDFKGDLKKLFGNLNLPLAIARGKVDVSGKGKMIVPGPAFLGQAYFGLPTSAGMSRPVFNESHATAASVATAQATASQDLGVINGTTGVAMTAITTGSPAIGQYKFTPYNSTGPVPAAYAFNASETALTVELNYLYPDASNGLSLPISGQLMGVTPQCQLIGFNTFRGKQYSIQLNAVVIGSFQIPTKQEDFWISDFDFAASLDASLNLGILSGDL